MPLKIDDYGVVLVTGAYGFIGSALVRHLLTNTDATVVAVDKFGIGSNKQSVPNRYETCRLFTRRVDICDYRAIEDVVLKYRPTLIYHLAAETHVDRSITDPGSFIENNVNGTFNLLEACRKLYARLPEWKKALFRFHHVSTDEVFGSLSDPDSYFTETSPYEPNSPYSASKAASDHLVRAWHTTYDLPVTISNCSNNYGPWQNVEKLIPKVISCAVSGQDIPLYGTGTNVRDWLFVEDHVDALVLCAERGVVGETYCIGGGAETPNIALIGTILTELQKLRPDLTGLMGLVKYVKDRPGHDYRYAIDASKISVNLGWQPKHTLSQGIEKTLAWYLERGF